MSGDVDFGASPCAVIVCTKLVDHVIPCGVSGSAQIRGTELVTSGESDGCVVWLVIEIGQQLKLDDRPRRVGELPPPDPLTVGHEFGISQRLLQPHCVNGAARDRQAG